MLAFAGAQRWATVAVVFNFVASGSIEFPADGRNNHEAANVRVMKSAS